MPRTIQDSFVNPFSSGGLIDRMFEASFPWKMLKAFEDGMPHEKAESFTPSLDITSDEKEYTLIADVPGVEKENVTLEVRDNVLKLSGEKKEEQKEKNGNTCLVVERCYGSFERAMTLPDDADVDHITASHKDGVLTVHIPRKNHTENTKSIAITAE
jgi:HSP20 family protein